MAKEKHKGNWKRTHKQNSPEIPSKAPFFNISFGTSRRSKCLLVGDHGRWGDAKQGTERSPAGLLPSLARGWEAQNIRFSLADAGLWGFVLWLRFVVFWLSFCSFCILVMIFGV